MEMKQELTRVKGIVMVLKEKLTSSEAPRPPNARCIDSSSPPSSSKRYHDICCNHPSSPPVVEVKLHRQGANTTAPHEPKRGLFGIRRALSRSSSPKGELEEEPAHADDKSAGSETGEKDEVIAVLTARLRAYERAGEVVNGRDALE